MSIYHDRYSKFRGNSEMKAIPGIIIPDSSTDKLVVYKQGTSRLDKLSNLYYLNPYSGWLILLANPEFGGLEFNIPDTTQIRIPYPFDNALERYSSQILIHKALYGE